MKTANSKKKLHTNELAVSELILNLNSKLIEFFGKPRKISKSNPLDILIATILSQNTNDINSHKAFLSLKSEFPDYNSIINVSQKKLQNVIKVAGLAQKKCKTIKNFLTKLEKDKGELSLNFLKKYSNEDAIKFLTSFKGIGVKTASCVLLFGMNRNVCPVDTHVFRVINRVGIINHYDRDKTFFKLSEILPKKIAYEFHTNIIKLGRSICTSKNPSCNICPIFEFCSYQKKSKSKQQNVNSKKRNVDFMLLDNV